MTDHITIPRATVEQALKAMDAAHHLLPGRYDQRILAIKKRHYDAITSLRAALAQQPGAWPLRARVWRRDSTSEWVLEIEGTLGDTYMSVRHTQPLSVAYEDVPGLPVAPAAAPVRQGEPWGWAIVDKDGNAAVMRARHVRFFGDPCFLNDPLGAENAAYQDRENPGLAPHRIVTLYAAPDGIGGEA